MPQVSGGVMAQRAAEAIAAYPQMSNVAIAKEIGVGSETSLAAQPPHMGKLINPPSVSAAERRRCQCGVRRQLYHVVQLPSALGLQS